MGNLYLRGIVSGAIITLVLLQLLILFTTKAGLLIPFLLVLLGFTSIWLQSKVVNSNNTIGEKKL